MDCSQASKELHAALTAVPISQTPTLFEYDSVTQLVVLCNEVPEAVINRLLNFYPAGDESAQMASIGFHQNSIIAFLDNGRIKHSLQAQHSDLSAVELAIERMNTVTPAPLSGEGNSEELQKRTTLTDWIETKTWTPLQAAMLVNGWQPSLLMTGIPKKKAWKRLTGETRMVFPNTFDPVRETLELWRSEDNGQERVKPLDFLAWCKTKKIINYHWPSVIEQEFQKTKQTTEPLEENTTLMEVSEQSEQPAPNKKTESIPEQLSEELTRNVFIPEILQRLGYDASKNNKNSIIRLMNYIDYRAGFNLEIPPKGGKVKKCCLPEWVVLKMIEHKTRNTKK